MLTINCLFLSRAHDRNKGTQKVSKGLSADQACGKLTQMHGLSKTSCVGSRSATSRPNKARSARQEVDL